MKAYRVVFTNFYEGSEGVATKRHTLIVTGDGIVPAYTKVVAYADALTLDGDAAIPGSASVREFVQMEEEAI